MPLRVAIELVDPQRPDRAAQSALRIAFDGLAPARPLHVLGLGWNAGPGTDIAPWTMAGIESAAKAASLTVEHESLSMGHEGGPRRESGIRIALPGARRPRAIPAPWFGRHACLVIPCAALDPGTTSGIGPLAAALRAVDRHIGGPRHRESPRVAARMLSTVFASVTIVVDGAWWAELSASSGTARSLLPLGRVLTMHTDQPDPTWARTLTQTFDLWLAYRLGISPRGAGLDHAIRGVGPGGKSRWPRASVTTARSSGSRGLAGRALEALWKPQPARTRLGPAVPGDLGRVWSSWPAGRGRP
ncbi:MAG: hypothetical protein KUG77_20260 [Nannocystaceae bacterium]|nr:hypothetical protein [Nannocystaceae bacterium]